MRLVTFTTDGALRLGAFIDKDQNIVDLAIAADEVFPDDNHAPFTSMLALIDGGDPALARAFELCDRTITWGIDSAIRARDSVRLEAPLPNPRRICATPARFATRVWPPAKTIPRQPSNATAPPARSTCPPNGLQHRSI